MGKHDNDRFPGDFMFRLTPIEKKEVIANCDHLASLKYSRSLPIAFTEHGAIMAASVLNSQRAVEMSVFVVRAFVKLRHAIAQHKTLSAKFDQLEQHLARHDGQIVELVQAIRRLATPDAATKRRRIGYRTEV